ncbi:MAG: hypothetical protein JRC60_00465 [Deltaproteobacteria bacterium]|nr:hypothetical protein [Deltaproteobacteria bacterium]
MALKDKLEKLKEKYDPFVGEKHQDAPLKQWKDSMDVCRLSEFLKIHKDQGFNLIDIAGKPSLHFKPGLQPEQKERWQLANQALDLLQAALPDLQNLISRGLITLNKNGSFE